MRKGEASRTAEFMALFRAIESSGPPERRLFNDPFARLFLRPPLQFVLRLSQLPLLGGIIPAFIDSAWPGARSSGIARTRFIDDLLRSALAEGIEQVVILGAGFDCRAYRIPGIDRTSVFEVDHPYTLAEKRKCLLRAFSFLPSHVRFVETDFNERQFDRAMASAGYVPTRRTFFIWEGVTNYLAEAAVDAMLCWFSAAAPGSKVCFTYVHRRVLENPEVFEGTERLFRTLQRTGEPWTFGLEPSEVQAYLAARGLELVDDLGAAEYRSCYLTGHSSLLRGYEFYRIAVARVSGTSSVGCSAPHR